MISYSAFGLLASSLITTPSIPLKIATGGFILAQLLFVAPLFYQAAKGRSSGFKYVVPIGGVGIRHRNQHKKGFPTGTVSPA